LVTGETTTLYQPPNPRHTKNPSVTMSPDGQSLALLLQQDPPGFNSVAVLPVNGGQPRILVTTSGGFGGMSLNWTPDSERILYLQTVNDRSDLWIVSAQGGTPKRLGIGVTRDAGVVQLSPDGKRLALVTRIAAG